RSDYRGQHFAERAWFRAARESRRGRYFVTVDEPASRRVLNIVQPILRSGRFEGAVVGVITLGQDSLITPAMTKNLPPLTEVALVDGEGRVIYRPGGENGRLPEAWASATLRAARQQAGTLRSPLGGEDSLFAFAPVGGGSPYSLVFRWPW